MLSPDTSRNVLLSRELYRDMRDCLNELVSIASKFLPKVTERVSNQLARIDIGTNQQDLRRVNRELHLTAHLVDAIEVLSTILNGAIVSNHVERKLGEHHIGESVTSLRSLQQNTELCSFGSRVETSDGEVKDCSLGHLFQRHMKELDAIAIDTPFLLIELPQPPSIRRVTYGR